MDAHQTVPSLAYCLAKCREQDGRTANPDNDWLNAVWVERNRLAFKRLTADVAGALHDAGVETVYENDDVARLKFTDDRAGVVACGELDLIMRRWNLQGDAKSILDGSKTLDGVIDELITRIRTS